MQEAIWEDLPQVLWRTGYSSLDLMKLLLITGPPVLNLCVVSLVGDEWSLCARPDWHLSLLFFSLSLSVVRLDKVMLCAILECLTLCHKHATKCVSTLFLAAVLLRYEEPSNAPCRIIKHQSKVWSIQCVVSPTPFFSPSISHSHTAQLSVSVPPHRC